ncbi:unnamed protein product, partial [Prorocentrum cordatum]
AAFARRSGGMGAQRTSGDPVNAGDPEGGGCGDGQKQQQDEVAEKFVILSLGLALPCQSTWGILLEFALARGAREGELPAEEDEDWLAESPGRGPSPEQGDGQALVPLELAPAQAQPGAPVAPAAGGVGEAPLQGSLASLALAMVEGRYLDGGVVALATATSLADRLGIETMGLPIDGLVDARFPRQASYLRAMPGNPPKAPRDAAGARADADQLRGVDHPFAGADGVGEGPPAPSADARGDGGGADLGAATDADAVELLSDACPCIFNSAAWCLLQVRTEMVALKVYRALSRMGAVASHLVHRANWNWPMPLLYSLKGASAACASGETRSCVLGACAENCCKFYAGRLDSPEAANELKGALAMADVGAADAERVRSVNQRGARFRVWTRVETVEEVSTSFTSCPAGDFDVGAGPCPADLQRRPAQKRRRRACDPRRGYNGLQHMWRALVHVNGAGCNLLSAWSRCVTREGNRQAMVDLRGGARARSAWPAKCARLPVRPKSSQAAQDSSAFSVVDRAAAPVGDIGAQVDTSTGAVLRCRRRALSVASGADRILGDVGGGSAPQRASAQEACAHEGDGEGLRLIEARIRAAFASLRSARPDKGAKAAARNRCNPTRDRAQRADLREVARRGEHASVGVQAPRRRARVATAAAGRFGRPGTSQSRSAQSVAESGGGRASSRGPPGSAEKARFDGCTPDLVINGILVEAASALSTNLASMEWNQVIAHLKELSVHEVEVFGKILAGAFEQVPDGAPSEIEIFKQHVEAMGMLLLHLPNDDPMSFSDCAPCMSMMISFLAGAADAPEWHPLAEVLGHGGRWFDFRASFRVGGPADVQEVEAWRKTCRGASSSTRVVEVAIECKLRSFMDSILRASANAVGMEVGDVLLEVVDNFSRVKGCEPDAPDDPPFDDDHRDPVSHAEHAMKCAIETSFNNVIDRYVAAENKGEPFQAIETFVEEKKHLQLPSGEDSTPILRATCHVMDNIELLVKAGVQLEQVGTIGPMVADAIDQRWVAMQMVFIVVPTDSNKASLAAVAARLADVFARVGVAKQVCEFYETSDADSNELRKAWERLGSALLGPPATESSAELRAEALGEPVCSSRGVFSPTCAKLAEVAAEFSDEYRNSTFDGFLDRGRALRATLRKLAGGVLNGSYFLGAFTGDLGNYDETMKFALATMFRQSGIISRLKSSHREMAIHLGEVTEQAKQLAIPAVKWKEYKDEWDRTFAVGNIAMTAASLAQNLEGGKSDEVARENLSSAAS